MAKPAEEYVVQVKELVEFSRSIDVTRLSPEYFVTFFQIRLIAVKALDLAEYAVGGHVKDFHRSCENLVQEIINHAVWLPSAAPILREMEKQVGIGPWKPLLRRLKRM